MGARNHIMGRHWAVALGDDVIDAVAFQIVVDMRIACETSCEPTLAAVCEIPLDAFEFAFAVGDEIFHDADDDVLPFGADMRNAGRPMAYFILNAEMLHDDSCPIFLHAR